MATATLDDLRKRAASGDTKAEIALAERLEAEGHYSDAINSFARAANRGDVEALTKVAMRLLIGLNVPVMPDRAIGLLNEATAKGSGEAAALLAVLHGLGAYMPQSWQMALDLLQRSAECGCKPSQEQLAILTNNRNLAAQARAGVIKAPDPWRRLREHIDIVAQTSAPPARTLNKAPLVCALPNLSTPDECDWLIARAHGRLVRAKVYDPGKRADIERETRTNTAAMFKLIDIDLIQVILQARMAAATGIPLAHMEPATILHYAPGEQITEHFDFVDPKVPNYREEIARNGQRVVTFLVYLNDDYEGGTTDFPRLGISHKGNKGEGLFFFNADAAGQADVRTVHAGRPPSTGEKWIVSQFIRNRPTVPGTALPL